TILYHDADLLAIHKPSGLLVHRTPLDHGSTQSCVTVLRDQLGITAQPLHRLDRPTSGVLLFGLTQKVITPMMQAFALGEIHKEYLTLVRGWTLDEGAIDHPLRVLQDRRGKKVKMGPLQEARTSYITEKRHEFAVPSGEFPTTRCSLVRVRPHSGRYRQIRRHFKHIYHPVIADTTFGDGATNRIFRAHFGIERLMLHAFSIRFTHPESKETVSIESPPEMCFTPGWHPVPSIDSPGFS
ncbi:hypothetical protein KKF84_10125, partial [Myxococcota bacterium]|nr:hypothetical protein [Myxococcota bacterium]